MSEVLGKYMVDYAPRKIPHRLGPFDDAGIPLFDLGRIRIMPQPVYHPIVIIQYALAHFDLSLSGNLDSENVFMRCARWLEDNAVEERDQRFLVWPYTYPLRTPPVPAPWISGMAQGQALSVLARSFKKTGSKATAEAATKVSRSFLYTVAEGGVITRFADGTCFIEEIACEPALHILNGCLYGLYGLFEYLSLFPDPHLQAVMDATVAGIESRLPAFDTGYWSRYSLGVRWHLAPVYYHKVHIRQLQYFGGLINRPAFSSCADRWQKYEQCRFNKVYQRILEFLQINSNRAMTILQLNALKYRT